MTLQMPLMDGRIYEMLGLCHHALVLKKATRRFLYFECRICDVTKKARKTTLYRKMLR